MENFKIKICEFLTRLMFTNVKAEIDIYRYIENLIYGNFAQEIAEKNRLDLLRTSYEEFPDIKKIMEKDNKAQCNSSNHKKSKYTIYSGGIS